jgi:response regulator NasT
MSSTPLPHFRIVLAEGEKDPRDSLEGLLRRLGHEVVASAATGRELVERCLALRPDLVVTDVALPDVDGVEAAEQIYRVVPIPVVLVSAHPQPERVARAEAGHLMALLTRPVRDSDLGPAVLLAVLRFGQAHKLAQEVAQLRQALEERKVIERAKGVLMKRGGVDEAEAFRRLQKVASDRNQKLAEVARTVLLAEEAFQPPARG